MLKKAIQEHLRWPGSRNITFLTNLDLLYESSHQKLGWQFTAGFVCVPADTPAKR